ncbi:MAG: TonB-dependent receptor [Flavobacteriales bacterium]|nr:TonB-dependent receptor [Flavobacteriales bacterium]MCX7768909.1 TonB-dependent receptor [Flavobacteriales bacterium]MDW8410035.1 TonB-dependent receptor [Flavobacteriales bacterium]
MKNGWLVWLALIWPFALAAQQNFGTVRGVAYNKKTGEPLIFLNVVLEGTRFGASTDINGFFSINRVPPGTYTLKASSLGFETYSETITVEPGKTLNKKIFLVPKAIEIDVFDVTAERENRKQEVNTGVTKITPEEIRRLPSVGGEADLAQYLQVLPGVVFTGDQGGQLYIRGGTPVQNKVILDGMIIYNPFHSIGLYSVFDTEIIRSADVYSGGYNAQYGSRISSVMDITTRDGNQKRHGGRFSMNSFTAKLQLEGPLRRMTESSKASASYLLSGRSCYLPYSSKLLYPYTENGRQGVPFGFNDLYGKISVNAGNGSRVGLFGFAFTDWASFEGVTDVRWNQYGGGSNFSLIPGSANVKVDGNFGYSYYKISMKEPLSKPRSSTVNGFNFGLHFSNYFSRDKLTYGLEAIGFATIFDFYNAAGRRIDQTENTTEMAVYVRYRMNRGIFVVDPGFRLHYYASLDEVSPEPRLAVKCNVSERFRLKASGGMYAQNLIAANSDRDVVNFFYGFLSGSDNLPSQFKGRPVHTRLQKAQHAIAGFEVDILDELTLNAEGYFKYFSALTNLNRDKLFEDNAANADKPDQIKKDFIREVGYSTGADLTIKYEKNRLYLWTVYSLLYTQRDDGLRQYVPVFDRRHNVNLVVSYRLGKKKEWEVNGRWNFGSGFPFTQTQGFYEKLPFQNNGLSLDYTSQNGELGILLGPINEGRLPTYHRLDLGVRWLKQVRENLRVEANFTVTNVYDRRNIFYVHRVTFQRVNQLPILPSLGLSVAF